MDRYGYRYFKYSDNGFQVFGQVDTRPAWPFTISSPGCSPSHTRFTPLAFRSKLKKIKLVSLSSHPLSSHFLSLTAAAQSHGSLLNGAASPHGSCPHFLASPPSLSNSPHTASLYLYDHVSAKKKNKWRKRGGVSLSLGRGSRLGWEMNWTKATQRHG